MKGILRSLGWVALLVTLFVGLSAPGWALSRDELPNPQQTANNWIVDRAHLLDAQTTAAVNQEIAQLQIKTGWAIAIVTVPTTAPAPTPASFAADLLQRWQHDPEHPLRGALMLVARDDRRVEIRTDGQTRRRLPDQQLASIIQDEMLPRFKQAAYAEGILAGTTAIARVLKTPNPFPIESFLLTVTVTLGTITLLGFLVRILIQKFVPASVLATPGTYGATGWGSGGGGSGGGGGGGAGGGW